MTLERASYLAEAYTLGVEGAPPLVYSQLDLRDRPDHPDHRFALALQPGAVTAVVGDEDSGVGDLGRYALGLDFPRSGDVLVFGSSMRGLSYRQLLVYRRRIGYVQGGDGLLQNLTLRANVSLPLAYASDHRTREVVARTDELLEALRIADVADARPAAVNEEVRRRTAMARSIALDPELLVLEQPFDGLTARAAHDLLNRVRYRKDNAPRTILITAQDLGTNVLSLVDRCIQCVDGLAVEGTR